jgi:hypothetical protein
MSISGQDPEWFLCIDVENKIELFKPFRMVEVVVWCGVRSRYLII